MIFSLFKMFSSQKLFSLTYIDVGKYWLSTIMAILISDIGIDQNFQIGASLVPSQHLIQMSADYSDGAFPSKIWMDQNR